MQIHSTTTPYPCRPTAFCGQVPQHRPYQNMPPPPPVARTAWNMEPSADPWTASWDTAAPEELSGFLLDVLLTPSLTTDPNASSGLPREDFSGPQMAPHLPPKAKSSVRSPKPSDRNCMTTSLGGGTAAPGAIQPPLASLDTLSHPSLESQAATAPADFSHVSRGHPTEPVTAPLQAPSSRKRSRARSERTDVQIAATNASTQPAVGRPAKKMKGATAAKPVLSRGEIAQAAKDGIVFAKFARFAPWPAQVSSQHAC